MTEHADVVVVGMGPGGEEAAGRLALAGLDVVGIEGKLLGGECPYWGCVPSKMMIRAANLLAEARRVPGMAGTSSVDPDWGPVARRIRDDATDNWNDRLAVERFEGKGGRFVRGWGTLTGPRTVAVGDREFEAATAVVLATGAKPWAPPIPGLAELADRYWTNREAIEAEAAPASLVILGGGAIGVELAQVFARFGGRVAVVEAADRIVAPEEPEARRAGGRGARARGRRHPHLGAHHRRQRARRGLRPAPRRRHGGDRGAPARGHRSPPRPRRPGRGGHRRRRQGTRRARRRAAAGDRGGVGPGRRHGHRRFTHVAMYQARIVAEDILGHDPEPANYRALPRVTFTDPEVGSVGLSEAGARQRGMSLRVGMYPIPSSTRGWIHKAGNEGFIKLVEDAGRGVLVGATSAGPTGGEVLSMLTLAVHAEIPTDTLRQMIYAYPTFHRAIEPALDALAPVS